MLLSSVGHKSQPKCVRPVVCVWFDEENAAGRGGVEMTLPSSLVSAGADSPPSGCMHMYISLYIYTITNSNTIIYTITISDISVYIYTGLG